MISIRRSRPGEGDRALAIWRAAVDATHDFLSREDRIELDAYASEFLSDVPTWMAVGADDWPLGFMVLSEGHMDALFIDPAHHGTGIGRALVRHALSLHDELQTDVNEQNVEAVGFYDRMGFVIIGRSETDDQGRPYPLLHLRYGKSG